MRSLRFGDQRDVIDRRSHMKILTILSIRDEGAI